MEANIEKECSALGGLFQTIINDMKGSYPIWEDFSTKAAKLHSTLKATLIATAAFLESFQKVADMATNTRGATREIGSALTRLCMRHRSIENKLRAFTSSIIDGMVCPLQEHMEDWKKTMVQLDKDHAREYKKARQEIKKASSDTIRLQKKVKKGKNDMQNRLDNALQDVNDKFLILEETEKNAVRTALIEERSRFCLFISFLKPVVDEEIALLTEVTHLQEIMDHLCMQASDPANLPPASEQVILDIKGSDAHTWSFQTPPSSPSSIGSRKSSMCSISSLNSSSSGSSKSHSPSHHLRYKSTTQPPPPGTIRLSSVSSQDSGFTSQDTLFLRPASPTPPDFMRQSLVADNSSGSGSTGTDGSNSSTPSSPYPGPPSSSASTWSNWPDPPNYHKQEPVPILERPHTISTAYEKSHTRPPLTSATFEPPDPQMLEKPQAQTAPATPNPYAVPVITPSMVKQAVRDSKIEMRPPLGPKPKGKPVAPPTVPDFNMPNPNQIIPQPVYVNTKELASIAARRHQSGISEDDEIVEEMEGEVKTEPGTTQAPNSVELAEAIKELEASTAELQMAYDSRQTSQSSLQCSSGYGTMSNTPSVSEDAIPPVGGRRRLSEQGFPAAHSGLATIRRSSLPAGKPPPPVRRNSSITGTSPLLQTIVQQQSPEQKGAGTRSGSSTPTPQGTPTHHRRTLSDVSNSQIDMQEIQRQNSCPDADMMQSRPQPGQVRQVSCPDASVLLSAQRPSQMPPWHDQAEDLPKGPGVVHTHASIIQSLNAKFAALQHAQPCGKGVPPPVSPKRKSVTSQSSEDETTPTGEPPVVTLMTQIEKGVRLRRVDKPNDRSAPKFS